MHLYSIEFLGNPQDLKVIEDYIVSLLRKPKESEEIAVTEVSSFSSPIEPEEKTISTKSQVAPQEAVHTPPDYKLQWKKKEKEKSVQPEQVKVSDQTKQSITATMKESNSTKANQDPRQMISPKSLHYQGLNAELADLYQLLKPSDSECNKKYFLP